MRTDLNRLAHGAVIIQQHHMQEYVHVVGIQMMAMALPGGRLQVQLHVSALRGATVEGQRHVLAEYGITESTVGAAT